MTSPEADLLPCKRCNGSGSIDDPNTPPHAWMTMTCPDCRGRRPVPAASAAMEGEVIAELTKQLTYARAIIQECSVILPDGAHCTRSRLRKLVDTLGETLG